MLGYRFRRLRLQLLVVVIILLTLYYYRESEYDSLALNLRKHAALVDSKEEERHPKFIENKNSGLEIVDSVAESQQEQQQPPTLHNSGAEDLSNYEILMVGLGSARVSTSGPKLPSVSVPRSEKYPVSSVNGIHSIKSSAGKEGLRRVQADRQKTENQEDQEKKQVIKDAFLVSWKQYEKHAYGFDEIRPVSNKSFDPFLGWSATMVDSLDTLYIMGLVEEFDAAVEFVKTIDFTNTFRKDIPLFETVIRYLGGLLSAYDVSGERYPALLNQAKILGDNLIGAFDTPNRMPITFYPWQDKDTKLRFRAGTDVTAAELGTLTLEFSRLAQLTGNDSYFDAVDRITDELYQFNQQGKSPISGLVPLHLDASGCQLVHTQSDEDAANDLVTLSKVRGDHNQVALKNLKVSNKFSDKIKDQVAQMDQQQQKKQKRGDDAGDEESHPILVPVGRKGEYRRGKCTPQNLDMAAHATPTKFTFAGGVDSVYEYYMKSYQLLKGDPMMTDKYKQLYLDLIEPAKEHILFRPRVRNNEGILFLGEQTIYEGSSLVTPTYSMGHLTCFAGGMFALASKLLDRPEDLDIAERVTQGCVWAYNSTRTGVMPESITVRRCPGNDWDGDCEFNEDVDNDDDDDKKNKNTLITVPKKKLVPDHKGGTRLSAANGAYDIPPDIETLSPSYYLRPEALESVFYMYRITGDEKWRNYGWDMIQSILRLTAIYSSDNEQVIGYAGVADVTDDTGSKNNIVDVEESFWMGETLKYAYLLFDDFDHVSLDDYVFNTEAHPFKLE